MEYHEASEELKHHLTQLSQLSSSILDEVLSLYLAFIEQAINLVLVQNDWEVQRLIYYISQITKQSRRAIPLHREFGFCISIGGKEVPSLFSSASHIGDHRPTTQVGPFTIWHLMMDAEVVDRAEQVWHPISTKSCHEGSNVDGFHIRVTPSVEVEADERIPST